MEYIKNLFRRILRTDTADKKLLLLRYVFSTAGVLIIGLGCGIIVEMAVGCDSYTCLTRGLYFILGEHSDFITFGHVNLAMNIVIFAFMLKIKPELIGYGTVVNMIAVGYIIDFVHFVFKSFGTSASELHFAVRLLVLAVTLPILALGNALYFEADLGVSPYDAAAFMAEKALNNRLSYKVLRTAGDIFCVAAGFCLSLVTGRQWETVNIGSVIIACFTGMLIVFWRKNVTEKLPISRAH